MLLAHWQPELLPAFITIAALVIGLHHRAYGECVKCGQHREPKCVCVGGNPDVPLVRRMNWRNKR